MKQLNYEGKLIDIKDEKESLKLVYLFNGGINYQSYCRDCNRNVCGICQSTKYGGFKILRKQVACNNFFSRTEVIARHFVKIKFPVYVKILGGAMDTIRLKKNKVYKVEDVIFFQYSYYHKEIFEYREVVAKIKEVFNVGNYIDIGFEVIRNVKKV